MVSNGSIGYSKTITTRVLMNEKTQYAKSIDNDYAYFFRSQLVIIGRGCIECPLWDGMDIIDVLKEEDKDKKWTKISEQQYEKEYLGPCKIKLGEQLIETGNRMVNHEK